MAAGFAAPASAATTTGNVTVKWNTAVTASLVLNTNYTAAGAAGAAQPGSFLVANNGGGGTCTPSVAAFANGTVDFGTVSGDATHATDCRYNNAVNAQITTNSVNWSLAQAWNPSGPTGGYLVCAFPNGYTYGSAINTATIPAAQSSAVAATTGAACPATSGTAMTLTTSPQSIASSTTAYPTTAANLGQDYELIVPANPPTGTQSPTVTFTVTFS